MLLAALPILVELFTSEGCSSCPPAEAVLAHLHEAQPAPDVQLVVLAEHVDYWDDLGWRDPFSSRVFTERQGRYGDRIYTPQVMVDGRTDVLGSDEQGIVRAAQAAAREPHGRLVLHRTPRGLKVTATALPAHGPAQVFLAVVEDGLVSKVLRGENQGRTLSHTAVVRALQPIGNIAAGAAQWEGEAELPAGAGWKRTRIAVFVQDRESLHVLAAGSL